MKSQGEKTYWNVRESEIDESLLRQIKKHNNTLRISVILIIILCSLCASLLALCNTASTNRTSLVLYCISAGSEVVSAIGLTIICIVSAVKLKKLKNAVIRNKIDNREESEPAE